MRSRSLTNSTKRGRFLVVAAVLFLAGRGQVTIAAAQSLADQASSKPIATKPLRELPSGFEEQVRRLERPPEPWKFPPAEDRIHRQGQPPLVGHLESLSAFAVIESARLDTADGTRGEAKTVRVPRAEIQFIFLDGAAFPGAPPLMPLAEDGALLATGEAVTGSVQISGDTITVGARSFAASEVRLIHLADPEAADFFAAREREKDEDQGGGDGAPEPPEAGPPPAPAGAACWHGRIDYTVIYYDRVTGSREESQVHWQLALYEVDRSRDTESAMIGLAVEWGQYDIVHTETDDDPLILHRPETCEVSGAIGRDELFAQIFYHRTTRELDPSQPTALRDGQYLLQSPYIDNQKLGWRNRQTTLDGGQEWYDYPPPFVRSLSVALGEGGLELEDDYTRMRGQVDHQLTDQHHQKGSWDLRRLDRCPAPPLAPSKAPDSTDCAHILLMIESYREYLEEVGPLADRIGGDLEASAAKLDQLVSDLAFNSQFFQQAMLLAGIGDISMKILKTLGPARLIGGAPTPGLANGIRWGFEMLGFLQNPAKWTTNKVFKPEAQVYEIYQRLQIIQALFEQDYDPALDYIGKNMEFFSGSDNKISRGTRKYVELARAVAPLIRKISLLMNEALQLHGDMQNARLQQEAWEEALEECEEDGP